MSFSRNMHFSEECLARGWTVTESPNPFLRYEGGLWVGRARLAVQGVRGIWCNVARFQGYGYILRPSVLDRVPLLS